LLFLRRNQNGDRDKALSILESLCQTKKTENELSNDITCLCGRIYKDKYTESNCEDKFSLEKAFQWYQRGFAASPNILYVRETKNHFIHIDYFSAGINLLFFMAITNDDLKKNSEASKISRLTKMKKFLIIFATKSKS
jgi:hypothetical protein